MRVNELRVGNFVYHEPTIDDWDVITIKEGSIIQCAISPDSYEPILLTEEWLLKFNIKQDEWFCDNSYKLSQNKLFENYDVSVCNVNKNNIVCFADVKYVHELQNLFFALTHEELTINNNDYVSN
jgi:hypothetical protein